MSFKITGLNFKSGSDTSFEHSVAMLPPKVKQAFYTVAQRKGVLSRGTWNGCAFNAAGGELGQEIKSVATAMQVFGASKFVVESFIRAWDQTKFRHGWERDFTATAKLMSLLEKIGLNTPPAQAGVVLYEDAAGLNDFLIDAELEEMITSINELSGV